MKKLFYKMMLVIFALFILNANRLKLEAEELITYTDAQGVMYVCYSSGEAVVRGYTDNIKENIIIPGKIINNGKTYEVTYIQSDAFRGCFKIKSIVIQEGIKSIGERAFYDCRELVTISIPKTVEEIGYYILFNCFKLTTIDVGLENKNYCTIQGALCSINYVWEEIWNEDYEEYEYIETDVVEGYKLLEYPGGKSGSFTIPSNMNIDNMALINRPGLTEINVESGHEQYFSIDGLLYLKYENENGYYLEVCPAGKKGKVVIADGTKHIDNSAISMSQATEIVIPDSVCYEYDYLFYRCKDLKKVTIGKSLDSLGFLKTCENLQEIIISPDNPNFKCLDNIVYDSNVEKILLIPNSRNGIYDMPDTVKGLGYSLSWQITDYYDYYNGNSEFHQIFSYGDTGFTEVNLGAAFESEETLNSKSNGKYTVDNNNKKYSTKDGVLYSKDGTVLYDWPGAKENGNIIIPDGVLRIDEYSFLNSAIGVQSITIPASVSLIGYEDYDEGDECWYVSEYEIYPGKICGYLGSYAEKYAKEYEIPFEALNKPTEPSTPEDPENPQTEEVKVAKISISGMSKKIAAGKKISLTAKVVPSKATNKEVTWSSSNKKYATVNSKGVVTTKKKGAGKSVIITAKAKDESGIKARYKISIMKHAVKSIRLTAKTKNLKVGKKLTLKATVKTTGKKVNKTLKWSSSNTKYVTVSSKGVVKAKKAGKGKRVKITARTTDGTGKKATITIKIK